MSEKKLKGAHKGATAIDASATSDIERVALAVKVLEGPVVGESGDEMD